MKRGRGASGQGLTSYRVFAVRSIAAVAVALSAGACAAHHHSAKPAGALPAAAAEPSPPVVVNVMPEFWRYWDAALGKESAEKVRLLREMVFAPHRDLYQEVVAVPDDARLARYLETIGEALPALRRVSDSFPDLLREAWASFVRAYPDFAQDVPVYAAPSLFAPSGQVRELGGRRIILFGLDSMATAPAWVSGHTTDVHHELFHAYHGQVNPEVAEAARNFLAPGRPSPLYARLWYEGLAVHATRRLNPDAPLRDLLMARTLGEAAPPILPRLALALRSRLDSTDGADVRTFFMFGSRRDAVPPRSAYYVGMRLAQELNGRFTLAQLARLQGPGLRTEIERALRGLEAATEEGEP